MAITKASLKSSIDAFLDDLATEIVTSALGDIPLVGAIALPAGQAVFGALGSLINNAIDAAGPDLADLVEALDALDGIDAVLDGDDIAIGISANETATLADAGFSAGAAVAGIGLSLGAQFSVALSAVLDTNLKLDGTTGDLWIVEIPGAKELTLSVISNVSLSGASNLGFLDLTVEDADTTQPEIELTATFDLPTGKAINAFDTPFDPTYTGTAGLDIDLTAQVAGGILPTITTNLVMEYNLVTNEPTISFNDVSVDIGSFLGVFSKVFGDLYEILDTFPLGVILDIATGPLPIIDEFAEKLGLTDYLDPVPGLLGGDGNVSLADLAVLYDKVTGAGISKFFESISTIDLIRDISQSLALGKLNLGDFAVTDNPLNSIDAFVGLLPVELKEILDEVLESSGIADEFTSKGGLKIPLLDDPTLIVKILLNDVFPGEVSLVEFDLSELAFESRNDFDFPILGPLGLTLEADVNVGIDIGIGYDTRGIATGEFEKGIFFTNFDENGNASSVDPIVFLETRVGAGVSLNAVVFRASATGGITFDIDAFLDDENNDGKLRVEEIGNCFFDPLEGSAGADVRVKLKIGFGPFSYTKTIPIVNVVLVDFSFGCPPPTSPIDRGLATLTDGNLILNTGGRAPIRLINEVPGNDLVDNEGYRIGFAVDPNTNAVIPGALAISAFGVVQTLGTQAAPAAIITGNLGERDDSLVVSADVTQAVEVRGGNGQDLLVGGAGADKLYGDNDADYLVGNGGDDLLDGGAGDDTLVGGAGADTLIGGSGVDEVSYAEANRALGVGVRLVKVAGVSGIVGFGGEAEGDRLSGIDHLTGTDFNDVLTADDELDGFAFAGRVLEGLAGNDILLGSNGKDFLIGGAGGDLMRGGNQVDGTSYVTSFGGVYINMLTRVYYGGDANGDWLDSVEEVYGSGARDTLIGDNAVNRLDGFFGDDVLDGAGGADTVSGDEGNDTIYARGDGDILDGGGLVTSPGVDLLTYRNLTTAGIVVDMSGRYATTNFSTYDSLAAGQYFDSTGTLVALAGYSTFENLEGTNLAGAGDSLSGDNANNVIWGLAGNDYLYGDNGNDRLIGGLGADTMAGEAGIDWAEYMDSTVGVIAYLNGTAGVGGTAQGDVLSTIENLLGSDQTDDLYGDANNNIIDPGLTGTSRYYDYVSGGDGIDTLRLDYSRADVGRGLSIGYFGGSATSGYGERLSTSGTTVLDAISFASIENMNVTGTRLADTVVARGGNDIIATGSGDDTLYAGLGWDIVLAGDGNDFVSYGTDNNLTLTTLGGTTAFFLDGGRGIDTLTLSAVQTTRNINMSGSATQYSGVNAVLSSGAAVMNFEILKDIWTGSGFDTLTQNGNYNNDFRTGDGSDTIRSGLGFDFVNGGTDTTGLRFAYDPNNYSINDVAAFRSARGDTLVLDYSSLTDASVSSVTYLTEAEISLFIADNYTNAGNYSTVRTDGSGTITNNVSFTEIERLDVTGSRFNDVLTGTFIDVEAGYYQCGPNRQTVARGDDILRGMLGNDLLLGYSGKDTLLGGDGNDELQGSQFAVRQYADVETLSLGLDIADVDTLTGGSGADLFVLGDRVQAHYLEASYDTNVSNGYAIITDFSSAAGDKVRLHGSSSEYFLSVHDGVTDIFKTVNAGDGDPFYYAPRADLVATLNGISGFNLNAAYVEYVDGNANFRTVTTTSGTNSGVSSVPVIQSAPNPVVTSAAPVTVAAAPPAPWITQEGDAAILLTKLGAGSGVVAGSQRLTIDGSSEGFGFFSGDPFGLGSGIVLSTGRVEDLDGANTVDSPAGPTATTIPITFVRIGSNGTSDIYRADLSGLGIDLNSLRISDGNTRTGGSGGVASGFDLDAVVLSTQRLDSVASGTLLDDPSVLSRVNAIDYNAGTLFFEPGTQRPPAGGYDYGPNLLGSINGLVQTPDDTLRNFGAVSPTSNWLTLGDGGSLGINLNQTVSTDGPMYLYIGEYGANGEAVIGEVTVSSDLIVPSGDLSTDLGAPGLPGDTTKMEYTFTPIAGSDLVTFQVVLFSEELPEHAGIVDPDQVKVTLNGISIASLSNGASADLNTLMSSPYYVGNSDLILNPAGTGPKAANVAADAYTKTLTFVGRVTAGVTNSLVVEVADTRDAYLDTGVLIKGGTFLNTGGLLPTNIAPFAVGDVANVAHNTAFTGNVLTNDVDPNGNALTSVLKTGPANGTLTLSTNGSFTYTPKVGFFGTDTFTYQARDASLLSDVATVTLVVARPNTIVADTDGPYAANEDTKLIVSASNGVLNGDSTPSGTLSAQLVTGTAKGALVLNADGSFTYTPQANFSGADSFVYRASNGTSTSSNVTVVINTAALNDAPTLVIGTPSAKLIESGVTPANAAVPGTPTATITLVKSDVESASLTTYDATGWTAAGAGQLSKVGTYGTVVLATATGVLTYTLDNARAATQALAAGVTVTDGFTVTVKDPNGALVTKTANFSIGGTNDAPTLTVGPQNITLVESGVAANGFAILGPSSATIALTKGDPDTGNTTAFDPTGWTAVGANILTKVGTYGTVSLNRTTGLLSYALDNSKAATKALTATMTVSDSFIIAVKDAAGASVSKTATFAIKGSNDAPTVTAGAQSGPLVEAGVTPAGVVVPGTSTASITVTSSDVDAGGTTAFDTTGWTPAGTGKFAKAGAYGSVVLTTATGVLSYTLDNARAATNALRAGVLTDDVFAVKVRDAGGATSTKFVHFDITGANDAPTLTVSTQVGAIVEAGVTPAGVVVPGSTSATIQMVKSDVDTGDATVFDTAGWTAAGAGKVSRSGIYGTVVLETATGKLTYTLDNTRSATNALAAGATGNDVFSVKVLDAAGASVTKTATFAVTGTNDAPTLTAGAPSAVLVETGTGVAGTSKSNVTLVKADPDAGSAPAFDTTGWTSAGAGKFTKAGTYGSVLLDTATSILTYTLDNAKAQTNDLETGDARTESFVITVKDAAGASASRTVVFAINGTNDGVTINGSANADVISATSTAAGQPLPTQYFDTIFGNGGNDLIAGLGGKDVMDGGEGSDTANYSEKTAAVFVTLNGATAASVLVGGVAEDTIKNFENLIGGAGNDGFTGDGLDNIVSGRGGKDVMDGAGGNDTADYAEKSTSVAVTLNGSTNAIVKVNALDEDTIRNIENLIGGTAGDTFNGDGLNNIFSGRGGNDVMDGRGGVDTSDYSEKTTSIAVTLNGATNAIVSVNGTAEDTIKNIENIIGGSAGDRLTGDGFANLLIGNAGNDTLAGAGGIDTLDGGVGIDTGDFSEKTTSVVVTLNGATNATVTVGGAAEDTIRNIENLIGGSANDTLTGDGLANVLSGRGGKDDLDGAVGIDTADYAEKTSSVVVTLNTSTFANVSVGGIAEDRVRNIENLIGGSAADTLTGDSLANIFSGRLGKDILDGLGGFDTSDYSEKSTSVSVTLTGATFATVSVGGVAEDSVRNIENLVGGSAADTFTGDSLANIFTGLGGKDILEGGAGLDTADYTEKNASVSVTLNGATSAIVTVSATAEDTIRNIENIYGGSANDTLIGDGLVNFLSGSAGNDLIRGGAGNDTLDGGNDIDTVDFSDKIVAVGLTLQGGTNATASVNGVAEDTIRNMENIIGGSAGDTFNGDGNANIFYGRGGSDTLDGAGGSDTADFSEKTTAVSVTLNTATLATVTVGGVAEDRVKNIENIVGGTAGDTLAGDAAANILLGGAGNDSLTGGGGKDTLDGGADIDTVLYSEKTTGILIALNGASNATVSVGGIAEDTLRNIENVTGGTAGDTITGDGSVNILLGNAGNDVLKGGLGNDTLDGGADLDTADFTDKAVAIVVTLNGATNATATIGAGGEVDTLRNIENVSGGTAGDTIVGDAFVNILLGNSGDDTFRGAGAADTIDGGAGVDTASYTDNTLAVAITLNTSINAIVSVGGVAEDTLRNIENISGGTAGDTIFGDSAANILLGNSGNDILRGGGGLDTLDGGGDVDTADYSDKAASVVVTLNGATNASVTVGGIVEDTIRNIENVTGGSLADTLTGDTLANTLFGGLGNDTLRGGAGADRFGFSSALNAATNRDSITDFNVTDDTILLDDAIFTALAPGALQAADFFIGTAAANTSQNIIYDNATGSLFYDADGLGGVAQVQFASLTAGLSITFNDFTVI